MALPINMFVDVVKSASGSVPGNLELPESMNACRSPRSYVAPPAASLRCPATGVISRIRRTLLSGSSASSTQRAII